VDYFFLGDPELVTAFRFVGISGFPVLSAADARDAFRRMTEGYDGTAAAVLPVAMANAGASAIAGEKTMGGAFAGAEFCRVLVMTEEVADWLGDSLIEWQLSNRYPLVVEVPGLMGRLPGRKTLVDSIREAIGIHV